MFSDSHFYDFINNQKNRKNLDIKISSNLEFLITLQNIIFNLNNVNFEESVEQTMKLFDKDFPETFNIILIQMLYYSFYSRRNECEICIKYLKNISNQEEEIISTEYGIIETFLKYILQIKSQESYYFIYQMLENKMIENKLIEWNIPKNIISKYFAQYDTDNQTIFVVYHPNDFFSSNYRELSMNNWKLHKKYIKEGNNPSETLKIIRNDEVQKLQEISSQTNFDFNQTIEPSLYERCSFINDGNISLIDYAAFFGSVKCFKYFLMNGANVKNTFKYAIVGGNIENIHLCEQNHSSFDDVYETAINFHLNDIFKYLYENKVQEIDIRELVKQCIKYSNYEILMFLLQEGFEINNDIINESAKVGNIYLVKYFLQNFPIPKDIFIFSTISGNTELVKYVLAQNEISKSKSIYLNLKF